MMNKNDRVRKDAPVPVLVALFLALVAMTAMAHEPVAPVRADGYSAAKAAEAFSNPENEKRAKEVANLLGYAGVDELVDAVKAAETTTFAKAFPTGFAFNSGIPESGGPVAWGSAPRRMAGSIPVLRLVGANEGYALKASCLNPLKPGSAPRRAATGPTGPTGPQGQARTQVLGDAENWALIATSGNAVVVSREVRVGCNDCGDSTPAPAPAPGRTEKCDPDWKGPHWCDSPAHTERVYISSCEEMLEHRAWHGRHRGAKPEPTPTKKPTPAPAPQTTVCPNGQTVPHWCDSDAHPGQIVQINTCEEAVAHKRLHCGPRPAQTPAGGHICFVKKPCEKHVHLSKREMRRQGWEIRRHGGHGFWARVGSTLTARAIEIAIREAFD